MGLLKKFYTECDSPGCIAEFGSTLPPFFATITELHRELRSCGWSVTRLAKSRSYRCHECTARDARRRLSKSATRKAQNGGHEANQRAAEAALRALGVRFAVEGGER